MFKHLESFYNNFIKQYLSPQAEDSNEEHKNLHYKKIKLAGQDIQNEILPLERRLKGVHKIGLLAYTGGHAGATFAAEYMPGIVGLLQSTDLSDDQIIIVMESLSGMCYAHLTNQCQARSLGLFNTLQELMDPSCPLSTRSKLWTCYTLNILCCNNVPVISTLIGSQSLRHSLEVLEGEDWFGWPKNHAQELLCMLGFWPPQPIKIPELRTADKQEHC